MNAYVLLTGSLYGAQEQRTSKAGKPFTTATIKASIGDASEFWKALAFNDTAQATLARLRAGDALSVQGALKIETGLSGMAIGLRACWSTGSTSQLASFPLLSGIEALNIIVDHDHNGAGEKAALARGRSESEPISACRGRRKSERCF